MNRTPLKERRQTAETLNALASMAWNAKNAFNRSRGQLSDLELQMRKEGNYAMALALRAINNDLTRYQPRDCPGSAPLIDAKDLV